MATSPLTRLNRPNNPFNPLRACIARPLFLPKNPVWGMASSPHSVASGDDGVSAVSPNTLLPVARKSSFFAHAGFLFLPNVL